MTSPPDRIAVVGAGHAGATFVALLRQAGYDGQVVLLGAEPHLPYQRPPLSKSFLTDSEPQWLRPESFYREHDVTVHRGATVTGLDLRRREVRTAHGHQVGFDVLVLATGARPRLLAVPGAAQPGVLSLRSLDDADRLRRAVAGRGPVAVVGGGYIGLEVAAVARSVGLPVTVVEREARVLARVASPALSSILTTHHRAQGTSVLTDAEVLAFESGADGLRALLLSDGTTVQADAAVVGVGAVPCDELAVAAGLQCDGGVVVDAASRTSDPGVLAIGDVTVRPGPGGTRRRLESIPSATEQAKQAVATVLGRPPPASEVPWFWSDQFDLKLKIAGTLRPPYETVLRGDPASGSFALFHHDEGRLVAVEAANAAGDFMAGRRILAADRAVDPSRIADPAVPPRELVPA